MKKRRSIKATKVRTEFGKLLEALATTGSVEITRYGRPIGIFTAPMTSDQVTQNEIFDLATLYTAGTITWRADEDESGISFGELLLVLGNLGLSLLQVDAERQLPQTALLPDGLARACGTCHRHDMALPTLSANNWLCAITH